MIPASSVLTVRSIRGGVATHRSGETFGPRVLEDWEIVWIRSGGGIYRADDRNMPIPPGSVLLAQPGVREAYAWDEVRPTSLIFLTFVITAIPKDWPAPEEWPVVVTTRYGDPVRSLLEWTIDRWFARPLTWIEQPGRELTRALETIVGVMLSARADHVVERPPRAPNAVQRALVYMTSLLGGEAPRSTSLPEIAAAASVSPKYLCRVFKQELDCSPMEVFRRMRLERSVVLLARSNVSVKEISWRVGFKSPYHFSRAFREAYGAPPTVVRESIQSGGTLPRSLLPDGVWNGGRAHG